jgi:hypothetical protein
VSRFDNLKTCVFNVVPPLERENPLNLWTEVWANKNGVPATGTDEERKKVLEILNKLLVSHRVHYYIKPEIETKGLEFLTAITKGLELENPRELSRLKGLLK